MLTYKASLASVKAQINKIRQAFGTPSITCGVLHHGEIIFRHAEGFANVETQRQPDADTVYPIASCTKAFVSATCAILAHDGLLSWDEPVSSYLPEFQTVHHEEIGRRATLVDLCSHATGLAPMENAILGFYDEYYNEGVDQVRISSHLPVECNFRSQFVYNNYMYGVAGEVIHRVCNKSAGAVMKEKLFQPLGLSRTCTSAAEYPSDGNIAKGYSVLDNGSLLLLGDPALQDGTAQASAGFVRSTVNDMLKWANTLMQAEMRQSDQGDLHGDDLLPGVAFTRLARMPITTDSIDSTDRAENRCALGWFCHTIPSRWLGPVSPNFVLLADPPVIGRESPARLALCHSGALGGFLTAFYTFPETCSAIIVMANSSPSRGDPTDLIAQSLCQELFDMQPRIELERFAQLAAETSGQIWTSLVHDWVVSRRKGRSPPAADYLGCYKNEGLALQIDVFPSRNTNKRSKRNAEQLTFSVNGRVRQTAKLRHYHDDIWTFLPDSRDDASRKGMERYMSLSLVLLVFVRDSSGRVSRLEWDLYGGDRDETYDVQPVRFEKID